MNFFCAGILLLCTVSVANADDRQVADAWLEAYQAQDFEAMGALLNESSRFIDPTSFGREGFDGPIDWMGPDAILSGIRAWGVTHAQYHFDDVFTSPGRVIYRGSIDVTYGTEDTRYSYNFPITTIITVESDHIAEHRDYTDYDGATALTHD
ncbi:nuclear transport factor 2 family protein [Hyphobacterium sp.]|uniref:nuclear transport factor 2 family protein n=1 Tax=Hyphobacterium sp. TaxID=2004662 RepID=UPI003BAB06E9